MAIPVEVRAVERPKSTIVRSNGKGNTTRYAVCAVNGSVRIPGKKNPRPIHGKVVGHIELNAKNQWVYVACGEKYEVSEESHQRFLTALTTIIPMASLYKSFAGVSPITLDRTTAALIGLKRILEVGEK